MDTTTTVSVTFLLVQSEPALPPPLDEEHAAATLLIEEHNGTTITYPAALWAAAFSSTDSALHAALALSHRWSTGSTADPVPLRMAIHSGPSGRIGKRYFGATLHRTAHLLQAVPPGQIVLSNQARDMLGDSLPKHITMHACGPGRLTDLLTADTVFQVHSPDLLPLAHPIRFLETYATNLPTQPTPVLGREQEIVAVQALLGQSDTRLVTLIAPSGTGKTRFSREAAGRLLDTFTHGIYFVNLAPITDPTLVISTIAHTLGLKDRSEAPIARQLQNYLHDRVVLLVLDNIEQVIDAAPEIDALLQTTRHLKILVTSHVPLGSRHEHPIILPPLDLPDPTLAPSIEHILDCTATALFVERLQTSDPAFMLDQDTAAMVAELCAAVNGIPLAIELVASYGDVFALSELRAQLGALQSSAADPITRPLTLQQVLDWSYIQLDPSTQTVFARLGVFVGGCTIEAAEAVCRLTDEEAVDVLNEIGVLLRRNRLLEEDLANDDPRYIMLDCMHDDACARLQARRETDRLRHQHTQYYVTMSDTAFAQLKSPQQLVWLQRFAGEQHNIRAALHDAHVHANGRALMSFCHGVLMYWYQHGLYSEGIAWSLAALAFAEQLTLKEHAGLHTDITLLYNALGDYEQAHAHSLRALALFREAEDDVNVMIALHNIGFNLRMRGRYAEAKPFLQESLQLNRLLSPSAISVDTPALSHTHLSYIAMKEGDLDAAGQHVAEALALARANGAPRLIVNALLHQGLLGLVRAELEIAREAFQEGLQISRSMGGHDKLAALLDGTAAIAAAWGLADQASRLLGAAEVRREQSGQAIPQFVEGEQYTQIVDGVQGQLDPAAFAILWTEGRTLSFDQSVMLGLAVLDEQRS